MRRAGSVTWGLMAVLALAACRGRAVTPADGGLPDRRMEREAGCEIYGDVRICPQRDAAPETDPDAALEEPEFDDTYCHVQQMPEEDPNTWCVEGTGEYENYSWSWDGGRWLAQGEMRYGDLYVVVYDLEDATQFFLGDVRKVPGSPRVHGNRLVYMEYADYPHIDDKTLELVEVDLETRQEIRRVTFRDEMNLGFFIDVYWPPYVVLGAGDSGYGEIRSLDSNEATMISDPEQDIQGTSMTERYVSWAADPFEVVPGRGKDVHYLDLETWEIHRITSWGAQYSTSVDGHRIVWRDSRRTGSILDTGWEGWDIYLHDIETGEQRLLSDDPYDQVNPWIKGDLVVWQDYRYTRGRFPICLADIYVYDISTGVGRKVTSVHWWWVAASPVYDGKIMVARYPPDTSTPHHQMCFFDLRAMGILDETGQHVLPE